MPTYCYHVLPAGNARSLYGPRLNIQLGTAYLRDQIDKFGRIEYVAAAYNAGPHRVEQYRGVPPYYETRAYIARIIRDFNRQKLAENPSLGTKQGKASHKPSNARTHPSAASPPQAGTRASR